MAPWEIASSPRNRFCRIAARTLKRLVLFCNLFGAFVEELK
jgi:hypothetical protein